MLRLSPLYTLLFTSLLAASSAQAATLHYQFDELLSGAPSQAKTNFASLQVTPGGSFGDPWKFKLSAYDLDVFGNYAFLSALVIDGRAWWLHISKPTAGSGVQKVSATHGGGPGGKFDFGFDLTGKKQDRLVNNEWVEWAVTGISSIRSLGIHIQGIGPKGKDSAWYGGIERPTPVPLPASVWFVITALLALAGNRKWRASRRNCRADSAPSLS